MKRERIGWWSADGRALFLTQDASFTASSCSDSTKQSQRRAMKGKRHQKEPVCACILNATAPPVVASSHCTYSCETASPPPSLSPSCFDLEATRTSCHTHNLLPLIINSQSNTNQCGIINLNHVCLYWINQARVNLLTLVKGQSAAEAS